MICHSKKIFLSCMATLLLNGLFASSLWARPDFPDMTRYFFSGDGKIRLVSEKNGKSFTGSYRAGRGIYSESALKRIYRVFDAPCDTRYAGLSMRLVEYLDFLEDRLTPGAQITIISGYRNPEYNAGIRNRGGLAAKASLHQYGMAADVKIEGVAARRLWEYVKGLGFGGAGYYHGNSVHVDVGPARFWDEKTTGVGTDISEDNKLIGLVTDCDIYQPKMMIMLRFIRMTAFPIDVDPEFSLVLQGGKDAPATVAAFTPAFAAPGESECRQFDDIDQMSHIRWDLPPGISPGRYKIRARFCGNAWKDMPQQIETPEFEIRRITREEK